jgi:hypothetical protein
MKIFFNIKNPYYRGLSPEVGDIIRLYNKTYILTANIETNIFEMKDMYVGEIKTYSLLRRPFEILLRNACKNDICSKSKIIQKDTIIKDYLQNIESDQTNDDYGINNNIKNNYNSYCSIM